MIAEGAARIEEIEIDLLLEGIQRRYGYDFTGYDGEVIAACVRRRLLAEGLPSVSALLDRLLRSPECLQRLLAEMSDTRPALFGEPAFYRALREQVVPLLRTYPFVRVWVTGCATGGEVHSLSILMHEERLGSRCQIFATDIDESILSQAREGRFLVGEAERYALDYQRAGGRASFQDYYRTEREWGILNPDLLRGVVFGTHFPVTDAPFNEFHLILCRALWPRLGRSLQHRVSDLLHRSLAPLGFLALGPGGTIGVSPYETSYEVFNDEARLYRRMR